MKTVVSGVKCVSERINSDRVDNPPQQKQASPIEFQEMRRRELMEKREAFEYLLEDTVLLMKGMGSQRLTPDTMVARWRSALENGDCAALAKAFDALCLESVDALAVLHKWMEFLGHEGIEIVDGDKDTVTVSVENRRFYKNGPDFKDGARCAVISHSWLANGDIYYKGRLCPEEAEEDHVGK